MSSPSLEELLAEEGFNGKKLKLKSRSSFESRAVSMPLYLYKDQNRLGSSSSARIKTERTRSDISRYRERNEESKGDRVRSRRPRINLVASEGISQGSKEKNLKEAEILEDTYSNSIHEVERLNVRLSSDFQENEAVNRRRRDAQETERFKDIFSNEVEKIERWNSYSSNALGEKDIYKDRSDKHLLGRTSFSNNSRKSLQEPEASYGKSKKTSRNGKAFEDFMSRKHLEHEQSVSKPALDEAAIQAMVSILSGYISRFLKDKEFRELIHCNCSSCLISNKLEEGHHSDNKVIANLEEAIEAIERVAEESGNAKELKKFSLQLSVITSLNSRNLTDEITSGIPNSHLSACAHLYLSVIYKLQKKDKVSAKHLLQVFCDSPFQARTNLLPELWDLVFLPYFSNLRLWYDQEETSIPDTSSRPRKMKLLDKVYNEILDSGTFQFAVYYKDWLTEGVEAPAIPSIHIPSMSIQGVPKGGIHGHSPELASPVGSVSSQPMISKKLYDAVFGNSNKLDGVGEVGNVEEEENFDNCGSSLDGTVEEEKRTVSHSHELGRHTEQPFQEDTTADANLSDGLLPTAEEGWNLHRVSAPREEELKSEAENIHFWPTTPGITPVFHELPHMKANELTLKKLAESVFQHPQTEDSVNLSTAIPILLSKMSMHDSYTKLSNISSCVEGQYVNDEYFEEGCFFSKTPKDFMCPLTGELFEDPVTLESGQTFERTAIKEWFDKGNKTCPTTGRNLECLTVPSTNCILKRVIDSWKSEHCRNVLAFASKVAENSLEHGFKSKDVRAVFLLEQLLIDSKTEERLINAKHLISLGGLQFLIQRIELGNMEEKTLVVQLLSCCIEADGGCRNYIAKNINKGCLLELLHNKQAKSRANVVTLLTELICLNRRTEITSFLRNLQKEGIMNTMHVLLVHLQSSPPVQRPLVAVLLLHFGLLVEPRKYSIYREEAVDSITVALECSLIDEKFQAHCFRSLLILGGHFSFSGELLIENWLLRQAGFYECDTNPLDDGLQRFEIDENIPLEEGKAREDWWKYLTISLLGSGKKSFLDIISKCLSSGNSTLVRMCLITVAWLSQALTVLSDTEFQLSAFSAFIPRLKEILENGNLPEHRVLTSMTLLNFSKISECRVLLMTIAEEILVPLRSLADVTWTAKRLHAIISGESLENLTGKQL